MTGVVVLYTCRCNYHTNETRYPPGTHNRKGIANVFYYLFYYIVSRKHIIRTLSVYYNIYIYYQVTNNDLKGIK